MLGQDFKNLLCLIIKLLRLDQAICLGSSMSFVLGTILQ